MGNENELTHHQSCPLPTFCELALKVGHEIPDVANCLYGTHKRTKTVVGTPEYYYLLAGITKLLQATQVLEVGTYLGGSAKALATGMLSSGTLLTIDINQQVAIASAGPTILQIESDSTSPSASAQVFQALQPPIDVLFIDSHHTAEAVTANLHLYAPTLQPKFIILDDIHLNESMDKAWTSLADAYDAYDASQLASRSCGFGVLRRE